MGAAVALIFAWPSEVCSVIAALATALGLGVFPAPHRVSAESITGWTYAAAASATVLILAGTAAADADTLHLLYGNVLAVNSNHAIALVAVAVAISIVYALFGSRFLLVIFDTEAAQVAGVNTRIWSIALNLSIGVAAATAVHEIGALLTFSLMTLAPVASLLVARRIRTAFVVSVLVGSAAVSGGLVMAFQLDLPPGPVSVALLVLAVVAAAVASHWREEFSATYGAITDQTIASFLLSGQYRETPLERCPAQQQLSDLARRLPLVDDDRAGILK